MMEDQTGNRAALEITDLTAGYRNRTVIHGISFAIKDREILAVIGTNGSGKSTLLKSIMGLTRIVRGSVLYFGRDVTTKPANAKVAAGMVYLPQGNRVFEDLTVRENLLMGGYILPKTEAERRLEGSLKMFPEIKAALKRPASTLSGGEQQMLAFARALILNPKVLLLDEPSVGLSPKLVQDVMERIVSIRDELGCAVLIVEQKVKQALGITDRVIGLRMGKIVFEGNPDEALKNGHTIFVG